MKSQRIPEDKLHLEGGESSYLKKQANEESLEISSTGYGYESVENVSIENLLESKPNSKPSCGGL